METAVKTPTEKKPNALLETKSLAAALPDTKSPDQRPKYVQILQDKNGHRSNKSQVSLGVSDSSANDNSLGEASAKTEPRKPRNNNNYRNKNITAPNGKRPFKVYHKKQEVVPLPSTVNVREMEISPENVLFFSGPTHYLSALYPVKIVVDGNHYNSVEHYYQACKLFTLVGKDTASELKSATTPIEVKKATKNILKGKVTPKQVAEWKAKDSFLVLKHAVMQKFVQHEDLKKALLETENKILIQTYLGDNFFAAGANVKYTTNWVTRHLNQSIKVPMEILPENFKYLPMVSNGKNAFGWILMSVREELRA